MWRSFSGCILIILLAIHLLNLYNVYARKAQINSFQMTVREKPIFNFLNAYLNEKHKLFAKFCVNRTVYNFDINITLNSLKKNCRPKKFMDIAVDGRRMFNFAYKNPLLSLFRKQILLHSNFQQLFPVWAVSTLKSFLDFLTKFSNIFSEFHIHHTELFNGKC